MSEVLYSFGNNVLGFNNAYLGNTNYVPPTPPTPTLPANTLRFQFDDTTYVPTDGVDSNKGTWSAYDASNGIYDWYCDPTVQSQYNPSWNSAFGGKLKTKRVSLIGAGDTSAVTSIQWMFSNCTALISTIVFDTSNVVDMSYAFNNTGLTSFPAFNTSNVTNMQSMLSSSSALTSIALLDTKKVTTFEWMLFSTRITEVPLFDMRSATTVRGMLEHTPITSVPLFNTSSVRNFESFLQGCKSITTIPAFNTSSATFTRGMLRDCENLRSVPLLDLSNVTDIQYMLAGCYRLTEIPQFNTVNVQYMQGFCQLASALTSIPLLRTDNVENMEDAFRGCTHVTTGALALYQQASGQTTPPEVYTNCFKGCGESTPASAPIHAEMAQIPESWGGTLPDGV